jgi:hypothetical protein
MLVEQEMTVEADKTSRRNNKIGNLYTNILRPYFFGRQEG